MNVILGAGLAGLSAGAWLTKAGKPVTVLEKDEKVGGLAKTISHGDFRFDLGGHRFLTDNQRVRDFVAELLGDSLLKVPRKSQIYIGGKHIDYPLSPANAIFGMGPAKTGAMLLDYGKEKLRSCIRPAPVTSLEDWVVSHFGRTIFNLYFRKYSEKVWGIDCQHISRDWVAQRIDDLSLRQYILHSLIRYHKRRAKTLTDTFSYPSEGIGQLPDRLQDRITAGNSVQTGAEINEILHDGGKITGIRFRQGGKILTSMGTRYISSIPVTRFLDKMTPRPPDEVLQAAARMRFRSLVIVALFVKKEKMTDLTWMYFPDEEIPFGRIHEPKNWSSALAPSGYSHIIAEYFCNDGDATWRAPDEALADVTAHHLEQLGFFQSAEVIGSRVLRIPYAYPVFDLQYQENLKITTDYLETFTNLYLVGRNGMFSYLNMDQAMESGFSTADRILAECRLPMRSPITAPPLPLIQPSFSS